MHFWWKYKSPQQILYADLKLRAVLANFEIHTTAVLYFVFMLYLWPYGLKHTSTLLISRPEIQYFLLEACPLRNSKPV